MTKSQYLQQHKTKHKIHLNSKKHKKKTEILRFIFKNKQKTTENLKMQAHL